MRLRERKLRTAANDVFKQLQAEAEVENIYNDPVKSKQMPGVAAVDQRPEDQRSRTGRRVHRTATATTCSKARSIAS